MRTLLYCGTPTPAGEKKVSWGVLEIHNDYRCQREAQNTQLHNSFADPPTSLAHTGLALDDFQGCVARLLPQTRQLLADEFFLRTKEH